MEDKLRFIDPHVHMTSRTTDDYEAMAAAGIVALIEPSFWLGQPRTQVGSFQDYYSSLVGWEPFRASQFGIKHYCTIGLNSKEANNEALAEQVMELLPLYVHKQNVVAIGEIGYDDQTAAEDKYFRIQLDLAKELGMTVQIHTPHRDKKSGTLKSMEVCLEHGLDPANVIIDHNNEETVKDVLDRGFKAAFTIYPNTKMGNDRMVEVVKKYGSKDIIVDSSADWGVSDPLAVPKTAALMLKKGISREDVIKTCYQNALDAYGRNGKMKEADWEDHKGIDQTELFNDNSVLRGQKPKVDADKIV
ncbi:TatD family hydrolase [Flavimarina sp. Hel_I_48]|uniref:TatD family hydrolase n=1 Tax=Flavimarina sp. Hel_I_48 TaxID=1392488 RepID=UPI0004DF61FD|nr:TatD family hydrolase [Flavimarina sp. Hel_I_48]